MASSQVALAGCLTATSAASCSSSAAIAPLPFKDLIFGVSGRQKNRFQKKTKINATCQTDPSLGRRSAVTSVAVTAVASLFASLTTTVQKSDAAGLPPKDETDIKICGAECEKTLEDIPSVTTPSGLVYKDIRVGGGPSPPIGFQVAANYVAMVPSGKIFDSSLERGLPYIFRVGSGQVIPGLDEGILSMKVGGIRRLFIPGPLAFPKGLAAAAGRPRVPPGTPVVFDVNLVYVPGLEDEE